jgi:hypothetical protein
MPATSSRRSLRLGSGSAVVVACVPPSGGQRPDANDDYVSCEASDGDKYKE